jgi:hypothetical protein
MTYGVLRIAAQCWWWMSSAEVSQPAATVSLYHGAQGRRTPDQDQLGALATARPPRRAARPNMRGQSLGPHHSNIRPGGTARVLVDLPCHSTCC